MRILIKNCNLISMDEKKDNIEYNVDILIEGNKIKSIAKDIDEECDKVIDATNKVVMPGLINTHSHISMSIFRETVDGYKTQDWLTKEIWPREDKLTNKDVYWATLLSCVEMIKTGTTTINDMYFFTEDIINAAVESGIRLQTTRTLMGTTEKDLSRLEELDKLIKDNKSDRVTFNAGIHGLYTTSPENVDKFVSYAEEHNIPIHMHFCENIEEREEIINKYNVLNPAEIIKSKFKGIHNILAHCVKLSDEDIKILKDTNSYISHCPISNLKLGCGISNIKEMINNNICVSLGTDGQGSGSNLDLFETMKFTALLQKGYYEDPCLLPAYEVLKMATINGAKTLGLDNEVGTIEVNKKADLIIINVDDVLTNPINNIFSEIVYNVKGTNVETTIIDGKILMENRKLNIDEEKIIAECNKINLD